MSNFWVAAMLTVGYFLGQLLGRILNRMRQNRLPAYETCLCGAPMLAGQCSVKGCVCSNQ